MSANFNREPQEASPVLRPSVVPDSGKIDSLILSTSKRTRHSVDFNDRTETLLNANRRIPQVVVVDRHDSVTVRNVVDQTLKRGCHVFSFSVVLITTTKCAVNGEENLQCHW